MPPSRRVGCPYRLVAGSAVGQWRNALGLLLLIIVQLTSLTGATDGSPDQHHVRQRRRAQSSSQQQEVASVALRQLQEVIGNSQEQKLGTDAAKAVTPDAFVPFRRFLGDNNNNQASAQQHADEQRQLQQQGSAGNTAKGTSQQPSKGSTTKGSATGATQQQSRVTANTTKTQPPQGGTPKGSTKSSSQGSSNSAPPANLTPYNMDEGTPVGKPGSGGKPTEPPTTMSQTNGIGKTPPTSAPTRVVITEPPASQSESSRENDKNEGGNNFSFGTDAPTMSPQGNDASQGEGALTKYPEKQDEGAHTPEDENLKPTATDDYAKTSTASNMDEEQVEDVEELEGELEREEKEARRIGGAGLGLALIAMIFTAHQMSENPDGIYARYVLKDMDC